MTVWMLREDFLGDILALSLILAALGNIKDRYELAMVDRRPAFGHFARS